MRNLTLPNLLSASRLLLSVPSFFYITTGAWIPAAVVIVVAVGTDVLDGYIARRQGTVSAIGGLLDHSSDAVFAATTLAALAFIDLVPMALPPLVMLAFIQYALDSRALAGLPLRASRIGRYNGIAYFVLAGFPAMQHALGIYLIPNRGFGLFGWLLIVTTVISMIDRLIALIRHRR
jgi:phosphatidylglycerophosphate synthase